MMLAKIKIISFIILLISYSSQTMNNIHLRSVNNFLESNNLIVFTSDTEVVVYDLIKRIFLYKI